MKKQSQLKADDDENDSIPGAIIGSAGAYYVAAGACARGLICSPTYGNMPHVDLLIQDLTGKGLVAVQVKTAKDAIRQRGRGEKVDHHYEWNLGQGAIEYAKHHLDSDSLLFAFVDLHDNKEGTSFDVYFLTPGEIAEYAEGIVSEKYGGDDSKWKWHRFHPPVAYMHGKRNNWSLLQNRAKATARFEF